MTTTAVHPSATAVRRLSTWTMTREALTIGFDTGDGFLGRCRGSDITEFRCGGRRFVNIVHPDHVDHVLHAARLNYEKSNEYEGIRACTGINLVTDEGESWAAHRSVLNPGFSRRNLDGMVDAMIGPITAATEAVTPRFDMHQTMVQTTLRVAADALFGQDVEPLVQSMNALATDGLQRAERMQRLGLLGLTPRRVFNVLMRLVHSGLRLPPPLREMQDFVLALDRAATAIIDERVAHPTDAPDLLNVLLNADGGSWPRQRVRDEVLTLIIAGHETSSNAMTWFWYLMTLHTDARDLMFAEIDEVLGGRMPTAADVSRLTWTTACLQESRRLFPAQWFARVAMADDIIGGHPVRRGTTILIPAHDIHLDERWWPDPESFDPTRFLGSAKDRHRSAYLPFGGGRRICIGQGFAMIEMVLIAAIMSRRFVFDLAPDFPVEFESTITLRPKDGLQMIAKVR